MITNLSVDFDKFNQFDPPAIFICNPNREKLEAIGRIIYDTQLNLKFNTLSEFSFKLPKSIDGGVTTLTAYDKIKVKRQILIENVGYFIITRANETSDGTTPVVEVSCQSLEGELINKKVNVLSGTFRLYNPLAPAPVAVTFAKDSSNITSSAVHTLAVGQSIRFSNINVGNFTSGKDYYVVAVVSSTQFKVATTPGGTAIIAGTVTSNGVLSPSPTDSLLTYLLSLINLNVTTNLGTLGGWKMASDPTSSLATKYRTFDVSDSTVYNFLMTQVAEAYECVFLFDTINREIHVKTLDEAVTKTSIYLSFDNLVTNSSFSEVSDEIVTALYVYGGDGIDIRSVNPIGGNILYNFDYFKNTGWMSQSLIDAINSWQTKISSKMTEYNGLMRNLLTYNKELATLNTELGTLKNEYAALEVALKAAIEAGTGVADAQTALTNKQNQINSKNEEITSKKNQISLTLIPITAINNDLSINNATNFSESQRVELSRYIIENTYQNENIIIPDSYTEAQAQQTKQELYTQALGVLGRVSKPRYEFSIDAVNFVQLKEYQAFTSQIPIQLGAQIMVEGTSLPIITVLLELQLSYDNPTSFSMTFSNRLRLDNGAFQYSDLVGQIVQTGASVSFDKPKWANWSDTYKSDVTEFITSSLNATKNEIINSTNQEIVINGAGLRGKKSNGKGSYESTQVWLTSNTLAFTDNNWKTAKTAVGKITFPNGQTGYGIAGQYILGNIIAGANLTISNGDNTFLVNQSGVQLINAKFITASSSGGAGMVIDSGATYILAIGTIDSNYNIKDAKFTVSKGGNVTMKGDLIAGNNYIYTNGNARIGALTINGETSTFIGTVKANKIEGEINWSQITGVPLDPSRVGSGYGANKISAGTSKPISGTLTADAIQVGFVSSPGNLLVTGNAYVMGRFDATSKIYLRFTDIETMFATQTWVTNTLSDYATQTWVNNNFIKSGQSFAASVLTINSDINVGGFTGVGSASDSVLFTFKDIYGTTRQLIFRAGICTGTS